MRISAVSLGSPRLPSPRCVSRLLLLPSGALGSKTECVFWDGSVRGGRYGGKYGVKAQACSPSCLCSAPFHVGKSFARGYDVRSCSALKDFVCDCAFCEVWPFKAPLLSNFSDSLCLTLHLLCVYTETRRKKPSPTCRIKSAVDTHHLQRHPRF